MIRTRPARRAIGAGVALAAALSGSQVAAASRVDGPVARVAATRPVVRLRDDFEAASHDEQVAVDALQRAQAHRRESEAQLGAIDREVAESESQARAVAADQARLDQARRNVEADVVRTRRRVERERSRVREAAGILYRSAGSSTPIVAVGDARARERESMHAAYLRQISEHVSERVDALHVAEDDARIARRSLRVRIAASDRAAADVRRRLADVASRRAAQAKLVDAARADEAHELELLGAARARRAEFERAAAANAAASSSVGQILQSRPGGRAAPGGVHLRMPADGPISSPFGERMHPIFHTMRMHTGIDIGAGYGAPVRAAATGTVVVAGVISGYGNAIVIDHGNGLATLYGHLSRFSVHQGVHVTVGQTIGAVGNTGNSTGPHLHFEVRINGTPVDPMPYLV
ncbi:MAG: peptidoglycan DD-metalloendopeptidase family protein [Acidimicrobiia bacterium]